MNFQHGMESGLTTVMIPQLRKEANSTEAISEEMASWIYSTYGYSAIPWNVIICICMHYFGRKNPFALTCLNQFATFTLLYFSNSVHQILIAQVMHGVTQACITSLGMIIVLEYVSPKNRSIFMTIKCASSFWGVWLSNSIGAFYHWKYVPLLGIILSCLYGTVIFWPESPQWLASVQKYEKCKEEYRWLRGIDEQSEKELRDLIQSQVDNRKVRKDIAQSLMVRMKKSICLKIFYKPMLITILLMAQYHLSGKIVLMFYAINIIKKITNNEFTAYMGMLILDGVTIAALYTGCIFSRVVTRRMLLFSSTALAVALLYIISIYLYLVESNILVEEKVVSIILLTLFSVFIGIGPMILLTSIACELAPLQFKSYITMIYSLSFAAFVSTSLKLFPLLNETFNLSGTFLFYAVGSTVCGIILYIYLPETKDKTLQEIENMFSDKKTIKEEGRLLSNN